MASDPTGYTGPHPDLHEQICEMANMLAGQSPDQYNWPERAFVPDDLEILGQRSWHDAPSLYPSFEGGSVSAALVEAKVEGRRYGGMVTAVQKPDDGAWGLMNANIGERQDRQVPAGDTGGAGWRFVGLYCNSAGSSSGVAAIEVEYANGTIHRAEREPDNCVMIFSPAPDWDQAEAEITIRYLDAANSIVEAYSRIFNPGPRPTS